MRTKVLSASGQGGRPDNSPGDPHVRLQSLLLLAGLFLGLVGFVGCEPPPAEV